MLRRALLSLIIVPFVVSCVANKNSIESSMNGSDSESISEFDPYVDGEDIFDQGKATLKIDGEYYFELCQGLYINNKPGLYQNDFNLKFAYNKQKGKLYYNYNGEKPLLNKIYALDPFKKVEIYENVPTDNEDIPMSTSVDEILRDYNNRCLANKG